jgi:hypothetical protein
MCLSPALGRIFIARQVRRRQCVSQLVCERLSVLLFSAFASVAMFFFLNSLKRNLSCRNTIHGMSYQQG